MELIIGTGGLTKQALNDILEYNKSSIDELVFFNDINKIRTYNGYKVINSFDEIDEEFTFVICINDSNLRKQFYSDLIKLGGKPRTLISKNANVFTETKKQISDCNLILPHTLIEPDCSIGKGNIINCYSCILHDSTIGDFNEIQPGVKLLGKTLIGSNCIIGANSIISKNVKICDNVIIEAGTVIDEDIEHPGIYNNYSIKNKY